MLRKLKRFYAEEEIIDGFSILGFDDCKNLEKFCNSLKSNIRNTRSNNISKTIDINSTTKKSISTKKITKLKSENKIPLTPTRITAQRKSKPDISLLSLSICKPKRRIHSSVALKHLETTQPKDLIDVTEANDFEKIISDKESSCLMSLKSEDSEEQHSEDNKIENRDLGRGSLDENFDKCDIEIKEDCSSNTNAEGSLIEEYSTIVNSTLSPVSLQPTNSLQFVEESMDLDSPEKVDKTPFKDISMENLSLQEDITIIDPVKTIEDSELKIEDDDCLIVSVGFDPDPKLNHIPITIYEQITEVVPLLKPAPALIFSVSNLHSIKKAIIIPPKTGNIRPPPLIPAPAQYFTIVQSEPCPVINSPYTKSNLSPKYRSRKRCQMKSSILKPPTKSIKPSTAIPIVSKSNGPPTDNVGTAIIKSLLQNNYLPNGKLYSIPTQSIRQSISTPTLLTASSSAPYRSNLLHSINYDMRLPRPIVTDSANSNQATKRVIGSPYFIRKTICHVHIAQSIHRKLSTHHLQNNCSLTNVFGLTKPRILRPIPQPLHPCPPYPSFKINDVFRSDSNIINKPINRFFYPKRPLQPFNTMSDMPVLIKPFNKTSLMSTDLSSSRHSMSIFPRHNIMLLKH